MLESHLTWVRGLKRKYKELFDGRKVAPYVGAWVETPRFFMLSVSSVSHLTWVRGLKHIHRIGDMHFDKVAPYVGAWVETATCLERFPSLKSHLTWVRGLKPP